MVVSRSNFDPLIDVVEALCYGWKLPEIQNLCQQFCASLEIQSLCQKFYASLEDNLVASSSSCGSVETCHFFTLQFPRGEKIRSGNRKAEKYC